MKLDTKGFTFSREEANGRLGGASYYLQWSLDHECGTKEALAIEAAAELINFLL